MSLISEKSSITTLTQYDLFGLPPVQTTVDSCIQTEHRPISVLNSGGHIDFVVPTALNEYILPREMMIHVKLRIILSKSDKSEVVSNDWNSISIVNNFLNALWQQVDFSLGDTQITSSLQTYSYKSYFETMLFCSENAKKSYLSSSGWYTDELWDTPNKPNLLRVKHIKHNTPQGVEADKDKEHSIGRICDFYGKLSADVASQGRAILGGTKLKVKLIQNPLGFFLMCSDEKIVPKIEFVEIALNIMRAKVSPDVVFAHSEALRIAPARYPIPRGDVRTTTINAGILNQTLDNVILNGQLPKRCFISFVSNESFNGSYKKNPYYFHHYDVNFLACFINSIQFPRQAFQPDFENSLYSREYMEFYRAADELSLHNHLSISYSEYSKGRTIFGFNFSPDLSDGCMASNYINPINNGSMRIEIHFKKPLPETINVLIYSEFDNLIMIPEDRNAILDYH